MPRRRPPRGLNAMKDKEQSDVHFQTVTCHRRSRVCGKHVDRRDCTDEGEVEVGHAARRRDWALQNLPSGGPTIWTSPPIPFARPFGTKPTVSVAIAGIESGANLDTDRFGFSVEPTDVDASGFKITIRRIQGVLYGVTVTWLAHGANKP
jgi:hypothetical protein